MIHSRTLAPILIFSLWCLFHTAPASAEIIQRAGPSDKHQDIVFLAEGYTASEKPLFDAAVSRGLQYLRQTSPYREYLGFMNIHKGFVSSPASGVTTDSSDTTVYQTTLGEDIAIGTVGNYGLLYRDASTYGADANFIVVICNNRMGRGSARGRVSVIFDRPDIGIVMAHEFGHMFCSLSDEYADEAVSERRLTSLGVPPERQGDDEAVRRALEPAIQRSPNLTLTLDRNQIKWKHWILADTQVPHDWRDDRVSAHLGGLYITKMVHRPQRNCLMKSPNLPPCKVCREYLVENFYQNNHHTDIVIEESPDHYVVTVNTLIKNPRITWENFNGFGAKVVIPRARIPVEGITVQVQDPNQWITRPTTRSLLTFRKKLPLMANPNFSIHDSQRPTEPQERQPQIQRPEQSVVPPASKFPRPMRVSKSTSVMLETDSLGRETGRREVLAVRTDASSTSGYVTFLNMNSSVSVTGPARNGFVPIEANGQKGWVLESHLKTGSSIGITGALDGITGNPGNQVGSSSQSGANSGVKLPIKPPTTPPKRVDQGRGLAKARVIGTDTRSTTYDRVRGRIEKHSLTVYRGDNYSSGWFTELKIGDTVQVIQKAQNGFTQIIVNGQPGFVRSDLIQ